MSGFDFNSLARHTLARGEHSKPLSQLADGDIYAVKTAGVGGSGYSIGLTQIDFAKQPAALQSVREFFQRNMNQLTPSEAQALTALSNRLGNQSVPTGSISSAEAAAAFKLLSSTDGKAVVNELDNIQINDLQTKYTTLVNAVQAAGRPEERGRYHFHLSL